EAVAGDERAVVLELVARDGDRLAVADGEEADAGRGVEARAARHLDGVAVVERRRRRDVLDEGEVVRTALVSLDGRVHEVERTFAGRRVRIAPVDGDARREREQRAGGQRGQSGDGPAGEGAHEVISGR